MHLFSSSRPPNPTLTHPPTDRNPYPSHLNQQLGFNVATFAGASIFTGCHFQEQNAVAAYHGVGQAFIVLGASSARPVVDSSRLRQPF